METVLTAWHSEAQVLPHAILKKAEVLCTALRLSVEQLMRDDAYINFSLEEVSFSLGPLHMKGQINIMTQHFGAKLNPSRQAVSAQALKVF